MGARAPAQIATLESFMVQDGRDRAKEHRGGVGIILKGSQLEALKPNRLAAIMMVMRMSGSPPQWVDGGSHSTRLGTSIWRTSPGDPYVRVKCSAPLRPASQ